MGQQTLFFVEGTDSRTTGINWGDSFAAKGGPGAGVDRFLSEAAARPYANNVVISPHVYPPCGPPPPYPGSPCSVLPEELSELRATQWAGTMHCSRPCTALACSPHAARTLSNDAHTSLACGSRMYVQNSDKSDCVHLQAHACLPGF